jgi:hypothetical protein
MGNTKKRKGPIESAKQFNIGTIKKGNDGNNWIIIATKNGTRRWKKQINNSKTKNVLKTPKGVNEYLTHDNGGRPFKVSVNNKNVNIYKLPTDYNFDNYPNKNNYTNLVKSYNNIKQIFIGKSIKGDDVNGNNKFGLGNSVLIEISNNRYVFIGETIYEFSTNSPITNFFSMIGNSDVPYPLALCKNNVYFLIDKGVNGYLSREYFLEFPKKYNWGLDSYSRLWGQYPFVIDENNITKMQYDKMNFSDKSKLQKKTQLLDKTKKILNIKIIQNRI